ncbi:MAG: sugar phosphate isomerase [Porticoccaceae bacterium]|nr:MAG: sugar phosphate isomerase [Porticoccaceae bacterium]
MRALGIAQLSALDLPLSSFVDLAARAGFDAVSLFVHAMGSIPADRVVRPAEARALADRLADRGLAVEGVECFPLAPGVAVEDYRSSLEVGAVLGARRASALLYDDDPARVEEGLGRLAELAAEYGLAVAVEFMPLARAARTFAEARALVARVGAPNLGIVVDLLHLVRAGEGPEALRAGAAAILGAQLCDGLDLTPGCDYADEAANHRLPPGAGRFPVVSFLRALPAGLAVELEVPEPPAADPAARLAALAEAGRRALVAAEGG